MCGRVIYTMWIIFNRHFSKPRGAMLMNTYAECWRIIIKVQEKFLRGSPLLKLHPHYCLIKLERHSIFCTLCFEIPRAALHKMFNQVYYLSFCFILLLSVSCKAQEKRSMEGNYGKKRKEIFKLNIQLYILLFIHFFIHPFR